MASPNLASSIKRRKVASSLTMKKVELEMMYSWLNLCLNALAHLKRNALLILA